MKLLILTIGVAAFVSHLSYDSTRVVVPVGMYDPAARAL